MNAKTILQIPIDKKLRDAAAAASRNQGFSSLQEAVRIFLHGMTEGTQRIAFNPPEIQLSPRAIRRYDKMTEDIESGKVKTKGFTNVKDMMKYLNS